MEMSFNTNDILQNDYVVQHTNSLNETWTLSRLGARICLSVGLDWPSFSPVDLNK